MADNKDISHKENNIKKEQKKSDIARREEEVLAFWNNNNIFKKSEEKDASKGEYVFYDGPPFANGPTHYGHILASTIKDAIPRYQTMRGFRVKRRWGWDCHGLPVENLIEKELGLKTKKDIESYGIEKFNDAARRSVMKYADDWRKIIPRLGRFVDMERDYKTMDTSYTESVWWIFKTLYDKKLIYKGFKAMHLCPRCGTTLSNFEVNQGYKDIKDFSVTVEFELEDSAGTDGRTQPTLSEAGEPKTFVLVWTTTPWTLPGNTAVAVNKDLEYVTIEKKDEGDGSLVRFILAKDRLEKVFGDDEYEIIDTYKGDILIGKKYKPPFDYFVDKNVEGKKNGWKIYHAPYVSTEDGTGIVHLAPAFGEEDLLLAQKEGIPIIHHVTQEGTFTDEVVDFKGMAVKPKEDHMSTDIEIIKALAHKGLLFAKEKIEHSYPHCWRCDTPLLNYASSSWFVEVTKFKNKLVSENKKVSWVPKEMGENRFGNWLEGARDWAISRSRYWGAPLPVWQNKKDNSYLAIGSIDELKAHTKRSGNTYLIMRHSEAVFNTKHKANSDTSVENPLTEKGRGRARLAAETLKKKHKIDTVDLIVHSPLQRTRETARLLGEELGLSKDILKEEVQLREIGFGKFEGGHIDEWIKFFGGNRYQMTIKPDGGESFGEVKNRMMKVLYGLEKEYTNKTILIVSHGGPLKMMQTGVRGYTEDECGLNEIDSRFDINTGEVRELPFVPLPHNKNYELDLHRPYIDEIEIVDSAGNSLERVPEVFDCWFESGSMPYAQQHYPFENTDTFEPKSSLFSRSKGYPADFIAEGTDQTRGWFYSLIVLGVGLFGKVPYKHVIVNGMILAEDGQKMSKRLNNYPDPVEVINTYGVDALRYYLLSSPIVQGEDLNFSEKGVDEVMKKLLIRLSNVTSFYELYRKDFARVDALEDETISKRAGAKEKSSNVLDVWILERTKELTKEVTEAMERYELDKATRPISLFIDDMSTWYIRRSRDRFKSEERADAIATTRSVLRELSKLIAPFMPFYAETLYQTVKVETDPESVHLCDWPKEGVIDEKILVEMKHVRDVVSLGLEARATAGIKVRQPLQSLVAEKCSLENEPQYAQLIKDEVNVKEVTFEGEKGVVTLDTELSKELKREGLVRDIIRQIQQLRKESQLSPQDTIALVIDTNEELKGVIKEHQEEIKQTALLKEIVFEPVQGEGVMVAGSKMVFKIKKTN